LEAIKYYYKHNNNYGMNQEKAKEMGFLHCEVEKRNGFGNE